MTYDEMNQFILNYLKNDKTGRAIMLTGEWGSGKSYYVQNSLISYLANPDTRTDADTKADADNEKYKTIVVSLYGMKSVSEISKAIYLEAKWDSIISHAPSKTKGLLGKIRDSKSETKATVQAGTKTIIKGVTSFFSIDISGNEDSLSALYRSVNLNNNLIILEDIERTKIDIIDLLGFVNNLCENDGVKILLVTNENELVSSQETTDDNGKKKIHYTDAALQYLRAKEKTVGDTISFTCDYLSVIQQIVGLFGASLENYHNPKAAEDIREIFTLLQSANLRAFIYGCQKCRNILEFISNNNISISDEIEKKIFYGIIAFTQRQSKGEELYFEAGTYLSPSLGLDEKYPLFLFCYKYIIEQTISKADIDRETGYYKDYVKKGKWNSGKDKDLNTIKKFYIKTAGEVTEALSQLPIKIKNGDIPYHDYGVIVNYIIALKYDTGIDLNYNEIIESILKELRELDDTIDFESLFNSGYSLNSPEAQQAFNDIKDKMKMALEHSEGTAFSYTPESIIGYYKSNSKILKKNMTVQGFAHLLDISQFATMLEHCSSEQIQNIRFVFLGLYRDVKERDYSLIMIEKDLPALKELRNSIFESPRFNHFDPIQIMQIKMFVNNLEEIIQSLKTKRNEKAHRGTIVAN